MSKRSRSGQSKALDPPPPQPQWCRPLRPRWSSSFCYVINDRDNKSHGRANDAPACDLNVALQVANVPARGVGRDRRQIKHARRRCLIGRRGRHGRNKPAKRVAKLRPDREPSHAGRHAVHLVRAGELERVAPFELRRALGHSSFPSVDKTATPFYKGRATSRCRGNVSPGGGLGSPRARIRWRAGCG